ncbi:nuclear transport factor 2 family protein [Rhodococcus globerulus]|uniref:nuclear transport factor 2 family protein n=1 Tax=Rhodococcus globerulus TaxID=33008 RepID=UPI00374F1F26
MTVTTSTSDQLQSLFIDWLKAISTRDVDTLRSLIDESWVYTDYTGHVHCRQEYLEIVSELVGDGHTTSLVEFNARGIADGIAIAHGRYTSRGILANGRVNAQDSQFTSVWQKRKSAWTCLTHQATNVGEAFT